MTDDSAPIEDSTLGFPAADTQTATLTQRMTRTALASVLTAGAVLATTLGALTVFMAPVAAVVGGDLVELEAVVGASIVGLCLASVWIGAVVGSLRVIVE